jgi:hypothetical protein
LIDRVYTDGSITGQNYANQFRLGTKYQSITAGEPTDKMVGYPNFCPTASDRGVGDNPGWLDGASARLVTLGSYNGVTEDLVSLGRGASYRSDYGSNIVRMYSDDGTPWWVQMGYGGNGYGFKIWSDAYKNELIPNWTVQYGSYTLPNSANINFVFWTQTDYFTPPGTTLSFFVSNDNGVTWEAYSGAGTTEHNFTSVGTTLLCKITAAGDVSKNAYRISSSDDLITYGSKYASEMDPLIKNKFSRIKLKGKNI